MKSKRSCDGGLRIQLAQFLEPLARTLTPDSADIDEIIEPIVVLRSKFLETQQEQMPGYYWPVTGKWRMRDLHKIYIDDEHYNHGHGYAYEKYGVDGDAGAVVIVRPDQYVSKVTALDDFVGIEEFLRGCFVAEKSLAGKL